MPTWMQGFCLGATIATVVYLLLTLWAAMSISTHHEPREPKQ